MKRIETIAALFLLTGSAVGFFLLINSKEENKGIKLLSPYEYLWMERAYPDTTFNHKAYTAAMMNIHRNQFANATNRDEAWTVEGPGNIGGRFNCLAAQPGNADIMYAGAALGGIFKTTNGGNTWSPIFDAQPFISIGAITIDPNNSNVVWAGTGDMNISGFCYTGDGIWKSEDGGNTWQHKGLAAQYIVSKIIIDPNNSSVIYAGTMGLPFERDENRGLYKSTDGGDTWQQILYVSDESGVIDLVMDKTNTQILYASTYNRIRTNYEIVAHGPDSKIWKTTDGGDTWTQLTSGLPTDEVGRIGLAIYDQDPDILYTIIADSTHYVKGIYRTTNGGDNWNTLDISSLEQSIYSGFGWYFGKIYVNPENPYQIYVLGVDSYTTDDTGASWNMIAPPWWEYEVHADSHYMEFVDGNTIILCTDGGLYRTENNCNTWQDIENIAVNQVYHTIEHPVFYGEYWCGVQDNGTSNGNSNSINEWQRQYGGDGFQTRFNYDNPEIFYVETQNGGLSYYDPFSDQFEGFTNGISEEEVRNWDMPYIISHHESGRMYTGTNRIYRVTNAPNGTWTPISDDLTDGLGEYEDKLHTITTIIESPLDEFVVYAGTADANVWRTITDTYQWENISAGLPDTYVTQVEVSPNIVSNVYVTQSGYRDNDYLPHIHKSTDYGDTWEDISGDLPQVAVNDIKIPEEFENILFAATDDGVYYTTNYGQNWLRLGNNMPMMPVFDIEFNHDQSRLIASTFARSVQTIDITTILSVSVPEVALQKPTFALYPNPAVNEIFVSAPFEKESLLRIYDSSGKVIVDQKMAANALVKVDLNGWNNGTYIAQLIGESITKTEKFVVTGSD